MPLSGFESVEELIEYTPVSSIRNAMAETHTGMRWSATLPMRDAPHALQTGKSDIRQLRNNVEFITRDARRRNSFTTP
jgi:hypothetical protein